MKRIIGLFDLGELESISDQLDKPNLCAGVLYKIIEASQHQTGRPWFGCHRYEWRHIALMSPNMYSRARMQLERAGLIKCESGRIPRINENIVWHTTDMDAKPPIPGENTTLYMSKPITIDYMEGMLS